MTSLSPAGGDRPGNRLGRGQARRDQECAHRGDLRGNATGRRDTRCRRDDRGTVFYRSLCARPAAELEQILDQVEAGLRDGGIGIGIDAG